MRYVHIMKLSSSRHHKKKFFCCGLSSNSLSLSLSFLNSGCVSTYKDCHSLFKGMVHNWSGGCHSIRPPPLRFYNRWGQYFWYSRYLPSILLNDLNYRYSLVPFFFLFHPSNGLWWFSHSYQSNYQITFSYHSAAIPELMTPCLCFEARGSILKVDVRDMNFPETVEVAFRNVWKWS